jgi:hypothetical protein
MTVHVFVDARRSIKNPGIRRHIARSIHRRKTRPSDTYLTSGTGGRTRPLFARCVEHCRFRGGVTASRSRRIHRLRIRRHRRSATARKREHQ